MALSVLDSINFSFGSVVNFTKSSNTKFLDTALVTTSFNRGGKYIYFNFNDTERRAPCYIEIAEKICQPYGFEKKISNLFFLEPYSNSKDVLIIEGVIENSGKQEKFFINSRERQNSFIRKIILEFYFSLFLVVITFFYSVGFIFFRRSSK